MPPTCAAPIRLFHVDPYPLDRHPPDWFISAFQRRADPRSAGRLRSDPSEPPALSSVGHRSEPCPPSRRLARAALDAQERSFFTIPPTSLSSCRSALPGVVRLGYHRHLARCGGAESTRSSSLHQTCPGDSIPAEVGPRLARPRPAQFGGVRFLKSGRASTCRRDRVVVRAQLGRRRIVSRNAPMRISMLHMPLLPRRFRPPQSWPSRPASGVG